MKTPHLSFTTAELLGMIASQREVNTLLAGENWLTAGNRYDRAIRNELSEAIDHHGWKWWSKQTPNMPQVELELIDIWHFVISLLLVGYNGSDSEVALATQRNINASAADFDDQAGKTIPDVLEDMIVPSTHMGRWIVYPNLPLAISAEGLHAQAMFFRAFCLSAARVGLTSEKLKRVYTGKNVLNIFRNRNGYKVGTYTKMWAGREDNEYLQDILATTSDSTEILAQLQAKYSSLVLNPINRAYENIGAEESKSPTPLEAPQVQG